MLAMPGRPSTQAVVVLIGRPNVGKSTLFQRLVGRRTTLIDRRAGSTRDVVEADGGLSDLRFRIVDTPGLEPGLQQNLPRARKQRSIVNKGQDEKELRAYPEMFTKFSDALGVDTMYEAMVREMNARTAALLDTYAQLALQEGSPGLLALLVTDGKEGIVPADREMSVWLRQKAVPTILVVNKCDSHEGIDSCAAACAELGFEDAVAISAEQGLGMADLFEALRHHLDAMPSASSPEPVPIQVAVVGRPNVGKSTFINALVGHDRLQTGPFPGVTRDPVPVQSQKYSNLTFIDTAGMRLEPRGHTGDPLIDQAQQLARQCLRRAHIACLVVDASRIAQSINETGSNDAVLTRTELKIIHEAHVLQGRPVLIVANKLDLVPPKLRNGEIERVLRSRLKHAAPEAAHAPILALTAQNLDDDEAQKVVGMLNDLNEKWSTLIGKTTLSRWLRVFAEQHPPPNKRNFAFIKQTGTQPPNFVAFGVPEARLPASYQRLMRAKLKSEFSLERMPIRIRFKSNHLRREGRRIE